VLVGWRMSGVADVALAIASFIALEVLKGLRAARRHRSTVAVVRIVAVVDVSVKTVGAVEPGAGADEDATSEPVGSIVAVGGAVVRGVVEVSIGANRSCADVDPDRNLRGSCGRQSDAA